MDEKCIVCLDTGCEYCTPKEVKVSESPSLTDYAICNHIIGFLGNEDVAQIVRVDSARGMKPYDYWKFCPECGEQIKPA